MTYISHVYAIRHTNSDRSASEDDGSIQKHCGRIIVSKACIWNADWTRHRPWKVSPTICQPTGLWAQKQPKKRHTDHAGVRRRKTSTLGNRRELRDRRAWLPPFSGDYGGPQRHLRSSSSGDGERLSLAILRSHAKNTRIASSTGFFRVGTRGTEWQAKKQWRHPPPDRAKGKNHDNGRLLHFECSWFPLNLAIYTSMQIVNDH